MYFLIPHKFYEALILLLSIIFMYHNEMQKLHIMKINLIISTFHQIISTCRFIRVVIESCYTYNPVLLPCSYAK